MPNIISASNPAYVNEQNTAINLDVQFDIFPEPVPFTATPNDPEPYGVELYNDAQAGQYGPVAPYVPPVQPVSTGTKTV